MLTIVLYVVFALIAGAFILFGLAVLLQKSMAKDAEEKAKADKKSGKPENPEMQR